MLQEGGESYYGDRPTGQKVDCWERGKVAIVSGFCCFVGRDADITTESCGSARLWQKRNKTWKNDMRLGITAGPP